VPFLTPCTVIRRLLSRLAARLRLDHADLVFEKRALSKAISYPSSLRTTVVGYGSVKWSKMSWYESVILSRVTATENG
jgi:hypothetical protein